MSRTATYNTTVRWAGEHWGHLVMGNGPEMKFSAPPDAHGHAGVFTPEDAFVAAVLTPSSDQKKKPMKAAPAMKYE